MRRSSHPADLAAKREAYYGRPPEQGLSGVSLGRFGPAEGSTTPPSAAAARPATTGGPVGERGVVPPRPIVPGERRYRDGDRVRHARFGEGTVVSSKLTRDDEEVTVAFPDNGVKKLLASLANLELLG